MSVTVDLLAFAKTRLAWEQDLFRRIYTQPDLTKADLDEVLALVKMAGSIDGIVSSTGPLPLAAEHVLHRPVDAAAVVLGSVGDVRNAMQLATGQTLTFAMEGITVIYGENGSGKSGYCKLLKQICRARKERIDDTVLENAYATGTRGRPTLTVQFQVGAEEPKRQDWESGSPPPEALSRITVFDSRLAPLYADKQDKIEFLPAGLDVLPRVVKACEDLSARLAAEIEPLRKVVTTALPEIPKDTAQALAVAKLIEKTPIKQIPTETELRDLASWTEDDEREETRIEEEIRSDPAARAREKSRGAGVVAGFESEIGSAEKLLSVAALAELNSKIQIHNTAKETAALAASAEFHDDPFAAVIGTNPWKQMFGFAEQVYRSTYGVPEFPTPGENEVCPLCAQELGSAAFERLERFRRLVSNAAANDAAAKLKVVMDIIEALEGLKLSTPQQIRTSLASFAPEGSDEVVVSEAAASWASAAETIRVTAIAAAKSLTLVADAAPLPEGVSESLKSWREALQSSASADMEAAADPERIGKLKASLLDFKARKALHDNLDPILLRRTQVIDLIKLSACIASRHTAAISSKNTELCERHLTEDFRKQLEAEIKDLGIDYLPIVVKGKTDKGVSYVGPDLTKSITAKTSSILSEGEFRALSLACFFAEVNSIDGHDGIILDDPVSSLDHRHVRQVVSRILKEAKKRQVIVFTHELSFYYELWHQAIETSVPLTRHWIVKTEEHGFGTIRNGASPWQAKNTRERLASLDAQLAILLASPDPSSEAYERSITDLYTSLRETWERLVEEWLLGGVVGRFQPGVQTQSLSGVEVREEDYTAVYFGMRKVSELSGHDWSKGRMPHVPTSDEMRDEIKKLRDYFGQLKKRSEELASQRKKLVNGPSVGKVMT
ncbi:AAA family ATPase [Rhizobium sp. L245/93]|uniref:AAA family ATPase n=1 Tax=Rhizobium sp. L245/93 TaxID=2819998 RepID=UPI001ADA2C4C|nr:AAA family ATPase [Rhizobium sp. L245/93]MBO9170026.1 AAA family ATPase [Rhizobium sp. L245/93]